jgi:ADP-heptose:LPS heptosyltransferase
MINEKDSNLFKKIQISTNAKKNLGVNCHSLKKKNDIEKTETKTFPKKTIVKSSFVRPLKKNIVKILEDQESVFITGGIGDVIAVESFLTNEEKESIITIFYATNKKDFIQILFDSLKSYKNLKSHSVVWDDFTKFWCFYSLEDFLNKTKLNNINPRLKRSKDLSILNFFDKIHKKEVEYNKSSFLQNTLANIANFNLPENSITILPYSNDKRNKKRDFDVKDWENCIDFLKKNNFKGIVLNEGSDIVPENEIIINLSNKTSLLESIEILKFSNGYLGIDSWLSVLAAKLFEIPLLQIKSNNQHCIFHAYCYFAPHTNFSFIKTQIESN